jgi:hypothetical protein
VEEISQTSYEVRFTATTYRYRAVHPRTQQWKRRFSLYSQAEEYAAEVKRAMALPRYAEDCGEDCETQEEWTDINMGEDGCIDSFDGIWEVTEVYKRLGDETAVADGRDTERD